MNEYSIIIQPTDNSGDHWLGNNSARASDRFAKWVHKATGAAVQVYSYRREAPRLTLGDFNIERT